MPFDTKGLAKLSEGDMSQTRTPLCTPTPGDLVLVTQTAWQWASQAYYKCHVYVPLPCYPDLVSSFLYPILPPPTLHPSYSAQKSLPVPTITEWSPDSSNPQESSRSETTGLETPSASPGQLLLCPPAASSRVTRYSLLSPIVPVVPLPPFSQSHGSTFPPPLKNPLKIFCSSFLKSFQNFLLKNSFIFSWILWETKVFKHF